MNFLGSAGQLYMFLLLVLLFIGSGFAIWSFINFLVDRIADKSISADKSRQPGGQAKNTIKYKENEKIKGGLFMVGNGWLKLGVVSLVGIVISVAILGLISTSSASVMGTNGQMNMNGQSMSSQSTDIHQQHVQQGLHGENTSNTQGMVNGQMSNMQGMANGNTQMFSGNGTQYDYSSMQQQLYQMQMQLNQMQQIIMNNGLNGNMGSMQQNSMNQMNQMQQSGTNQMGQMQQ